MDVAPGRVLVVDDNRTVRTKMSIAVKRLGHSVEQAEDGGPALEQLRGGSFDLMLLDIEMPRMDGYELATVMKNDPRLKHIPIIMITSRTGAKHRDRAVEIGVERYLGKPYQEPELMANVQELLKEKVTEN